MSILPSLKRENSRLFPIEFRNQENDHGVNFKSSKEHTPDEYPFAQIRDLGKIFNGPHKTEAGADIADSCGDSCNSGDEIHTEACQQYSGKREDTDIESEEAENASGNIFGDRFAGNLDVAHDLRMDE